jgi:hypothetical protein
VILTGPGRAMSSIVTLLMSFSAACALSETSRVMAFASVDVDHACWIASTRSWDDSLPLLKSELTISRRYSAGFVLLGIG